MVAGLFYGLTACFPVLISLTMAIRRLVILAAALLFLAAPGLAHPSSTYKVRKGDTLSSISKRFRVPAKRVQAENRLPSTRVVAGQTLRIPGKTPARRAGKGSRKVAGKAPGKVVGKAPGKSAPARVPARLHTVRRGETLGSIARKHGLSTRELARRNDLGTDRILPGQKLALFERAGEDPVPAAVPRFPDPAPVVTEEELHEAARPLPTQDDAAESPQHRAIRVAKKMLTTPYVWGGTSLTGMDCSGFVWKVFAMLNHDLPRSAREQFRVGREVGKDELSVGDLVFFQTYAKYPSHVGIYLGDNRFIHASSGSRQVKITSMDDPYYTRRYIGAKRLFFVEDDPVN